MLRLASDADVNGRILRGLPRLVPGIDLVRVQDHLPEATPDPIVLAWAAEAGRVLITNDRDTMLSLAFERAAAKDPAPGVIATNDTQDIGDAVEDIALIAVCMSEEEIRTRVVVFLPFRG